MADSVRAAVRERLRPRSVLIYVAFFGFLFWFFDTPTTQFGTTLATGAVFGLSDVLIEVYDLRSAVKSLAFGLFALVSAAGLFALGGSGAGVAVVFALGGAWLALDAVQTIRHEGLKADDDQLDDRDGHDVYREYVVRQVDSELRERALTRRELVATLDADEQAIDRALDVLAERGLLSRTGSELRVSSPPQPGALERARGGIAASLARLARPLTIEFTDETGGDDARSRRDETGARNGGREREHESA